MSLPLPIAAAFTGTDLRVAPPIVAALIKVAALGFMIVVIHIGWLVAGTSLSHLLRDPASSRVVNCLLAAALVATTLLGLFGR